MTFENTAYARKAGPSQIDAVWEPREECGSCMMKTGAAVADRMTCEKRRLLFEHCGEGSFFAWRIKNEENIQHGACLCIRHRICRVGRCPDGKGRLRRFHGGRACIPSLPLAVSCVERCHLRHGGILLAGGVAARHVPAAAAFPCVVSLPAVVYGYEKHWTFCDRFPWRKYFAPDAAAQTSAK